MEELTEIECNFFGEKLFEKFYIFTVGSVTQKTPTP